MHFTLKNHAVSYRLICSQNSSAVVVISSCINKNKSTLVTPTKSSNLRKSAQRSNILSLTQNYFGGLNMQTRPLIQRLLEKEFIHDDYAEMLEQYLDGIPLIPELKTIINTRHQSRAESSGSTDTFFTCSTFCFSTSYLCLYLFSTTALTAFSYTAMGSPQFTCCLHS